MHLFVKSQIVRGVDFYLPVAKKQIYPLIWTFLWKVLIHSTITNITAINTHPLSIYAHFTFASTDNIVIYFTVCSTGNLGNLEKYLSCIRGRLLNRTIRTLHSENISGKYIYIYYLSEDLCATSMYINWCMHKKYSWNMRANANYLFPFASLLRASLEMTWPQTRRTGGFESLLCCLNIGHANMEWYLHSWPRSISTCNTTYGF